MGSFVGATNKVDNFEDATWDDATVENNEGILDLTQDFASKEAGIMGKMSCSNSVFGDPLPGIVKSCFCESNTSQEETEIEVLGNVKSQITNIRFQEDDYIEQNNSNDWHFVWITNPTCDGVNFKWNNKAGRQWSLKAVHEGD